MMGKTARRIKWTVVFSWVNDQAISVIGEQTWNAIVSAARQQLTSVGIDHLSLRDASLLALGLWMGMAYATVAPAKGDSVMYVAPLETPDEADG